ncbi:MAG: TraR/DksA C4-type zinc finger protein [Proteobacteria bacterium]|nr:TraR/DksA C4-type zinc finger protein [Pseudomonadota bacterium]
MIDEIDIATERIERDLAAALDAHAASFAAQPRSWDGLCADCGKPIEPARLAALHGCTIRCAACAHAFALRLKLRRPT